jgi:hypothetical protein
VHQSARVQGFGCRPARAVRHPPAAGVRKPPRHEIAGCWALAGSELYGDLRLAPRLIAGGTSARGDVHGRPLRAGGEQDRGPVVGLAGNERHRGLEHAADLVERGDGRTNVLQIRCSTRSSLPPSSCSFTGSQTQWAKLTSMRRTGAGRYRAYRQRHIDICVPRIAANSAAQSLKEMKSIGAQGQLPTSASITLFVAPIPLADPHPSWQPWSMGELRRLANMSQCRPNCADNCHSNDISK